MEIDKYLVAKKVFSAYLSHRVDDNEFDVIGDGLTFFEWIHLLIQQGWDRNTFYKMVIESWNEFPNVPDSVELFLQDLIMDTMGHCDVNYIDRMYGEPEDKDELVHFVRSLKWMRE